MNKTLLISIMLLIYSGISAQGSNRGWHHLDLSKDSIPGISSNRAYEELLKGRKKVPVIVAVIDGGVDYEHEDLKDVMWHNPGEIPGDSIDNDKNGYIDDVYGWNFIGGKDGKNVNWDNLEVARLYKVLHYKYKDADPKKLNKKQKKEYKLYLKVKEDMDKNIKKIKNRLEKYEKRKASVMEALDKVGMALKAKGLSIDQLDSLDANDPELQAGIKYIKRVSDLIPEMKSIDEVKEFYESQFKGAIEHFSNQLNYHYNPDPKPDPRAIVGDDYNNPKERYYGNNDVKGPDAAHGTHVAGIIAAVRNNGIGMNGIADSVLIMAIRVVPNGDERDKDVANGIRYAVDNGAQIINMSFGKNYKWDKKTVDDAVNYADKKGVLMIHAAGNSAENNDEVIHYPSDTYEKMKWFFKRHANNWLEVGASSYQNDSNFVARFSNYGKKNVDVFAPGVAIYSTTPGNTYASFNGTSMATPVVSGVAAVLKSYFPKLSAKEIKKIIMESSVKKNFKVKKPGSKDEKVDFSDLSVSGGEVNLYNAIKMALEKYPDKAAK